MDSNKGTPLVEYALIVIIVAVVVIVIVSLLGDSIGNFIVNAINP